MAGQGSLAPDVPPASSRRPEAVLPAHDVLSPDIQSIPLVVASPHSGSAYPGDFLASSALDFDILRRSEDSYVDRLGNGAVQVGAPLLRARFPRTYLDVNREPFELDPAMFADALPAYVRTRSPRIAAGMGTIARTVAGLEIYAGKLSFREALRRIESLHAPYHATLSGLVRITRARHGRALLVDLHSMPSAGRGGRWPEGRAGADIVLGDGHGKTCADELVGLARECFEARGYSVVRNDPFSGGYTTRRYGRPDQGAHALQIEMNRASYMDEESLEPKREFRDLAETLTGLFASLGAAVRDMAGSGTPAGAGQGPEAFDEMLPTRSNPL